MERAKHDLKKKSYLLAFQKQTFHKIDCLSFSLQLEKAAEWKRWNKYGMGPLINPFVIPLLETKSNKITGTLNKEGRRMGGRYGVNSVGPTWESLYCWTNKTD
jgi:hypothetical protein